MTATASKIKYKLPPRTAKEVFEMLPEGTLAEVIDNTIYMSPAPLFYHQDVLADLFTVINNHVKALNLGKCVFSAVDVYLDDENIVQPDMLFISNANLKIVIDGKIKGVPEIHIEVLSSNRNYDLEKKKALYEKFGVKEYFVVDPATKETFTYYHDGQKYIQQQSK